MRPIHLAAHRRIFWVRPQRVQFRATPRSLTVTTVPGFGHPPCLGRKLRYWLGVCPETPSRITELSEHESNACEAKEGERIVVEIFPILRKPATVVEPADCSLDNPALRQNDKALGSIATTHDLGYQAGHGERQAVLKQWPCVGGVGKQLLKKREPREQRRQDHQPAVAILHIGRCHQRVQQQSHGVDEDMQLLALYQLAGIPLPLRLRRSHKCESNSASPDLRL